MKNGYGWGFAMWRWGTLFSDQHICSLPKTWTKPRRISGRILVKLGRTYGDFQCWRKLRSCACASRWERNQSWAHTNSMSYAWTTKYASKNHALPTGDLIWRLGDFYQSVVIFWHDNIDFGSYKGLFEWYFGWGCKRNSTGDCNQVPYLAYQNACRMCHLQS